MGGLSTDNRLTQSKLSYSMGVMGYTQVKITVETREKLRKLAKRHKRTMGNMVEVLVDGAK